MKISEVINPIPIMEKMDSLAEASAAQQMAEFKNAAMRHAARMQQYKTWSTLEEIAIRLKEHEESAQKALEAGKKLSAEIREKFNLPSDDPLLPENLPAHMRGQSPSTVRAMLRQESWEYDRELMMWKKKNV